MTAAPERGWLAPKPPADAEDRSTSGQHIPLQAGTTTCWWFDIGPAATAPPRRLWISVEVAEFPWPTSGSQDTRGSS
jgi:hypothetical protein